MTGHWKLSITITGREKHKARKVRERLEQDDNVATTDAKKKVKWDNKCSTGYEHFTGKWRTTHEYFRNAEYRSTGILPGLPQHMSNTGVGLRPLPCSSLSGTFLGDLLPCHSFHNLLATPSSGDTFLPSSRLLFPAATYCQFISEAKLKPTSSALLFQWLAITLRIRATPSSNTRFYLTWFYSSLASPTSALQYSPGGQLVISRPMSPFFCL